MTEHQKRPREPDWPPPIEEQLLRDWASFGIARLERHLAQHAAFDAWLDDDDHDSNSAR